jgi:hypothetical protein
LAEHTSGQLRRKQSVSDEQSRWIAQCVEPTTDLSAPGLGTSKPRFALMCPGDFVEEFQEERMRKTLIFAAAAGIAVSLGGFGANAMTSIPPAGLRVAFDAMDNSALVHCRPYRHHHPWGYGYGCDGGGSSVEIRSGHRGRVGIEERERSSIHSRTTTRGETSVRGSSKTTTGETSTKPGTSTTGQGTTKSRVNTGGSAGGSIGGGTSGSSGASGGTSGGPSGQKQ